MVFGLISHRDILVKVTIAFIDYEFWSVLRVGGVNQLNKTPPKFNIKNRIK